MNYLTRCWNFLSPLKSTFSQEYFHRFHFDVFTIFFRARSIGSTESLVDFTKKVFSKSPARFWRKILFDFTWPSWAEWFLIRPKLLSMPYLQAIKYPNMSISIAILFSTPIPSNHSRKSSSHNRITLEHIHCLLFADFMWLSNKNPEKMNVDCFWFCYICMFDRICISFVFQISIFPQVS